MALINSPGGNTMLSTIRKGAMTAAGLGALALGGSAIAGAADNSTTAGTASSGTKAPSPHQGRPQRQPLSSDAAAKVKAAALEKVPGATVLRTEAGGPYGTPYHAHIKKADGTLQVVLVNSSFEATAVQAERARGGRGPGGPGGPGMHGGGRGETALTGETKQKVEAAVLAKYEGATIVRTETNRDSSAPYESHIRTSAGKELEVLVSKAFEVVGANERPAHP
jgi:Spy/CpxP family protein refolding chaperone